VYASNAGRTPSRHHTAHMLPPTLPPPVANVTIGNATSIDTCENSLPSWGPPVGILLSTCASIGINVGQNLQANGIGHLPDNEKTMPHKSKLWQLGMVVFISSSLLNFAALALAPASILTPIESIQFVTNIIYNRVVNDAPVSPMMGAGVGFAVLGTCLTVIFGAQSEGCFQLDHLESFWARPVWLFYFTGSLAVAAVTWVLHAMYRARAKTDEAFAARTAILRPVLYTVSSALAGGSQVITHSKGLSTLLGLALAGDAVAVFTDWTLYVELTLTVCCGILWVTRQTLGLGIYDPLIILPLLIGSFILFGGISGGIFFKEFNYLAVGRLGAFNWVLYILGMLSVLLGLSLIAVAGTRLQRQRDAEARVAGATGAADGAAAEGAPGTAEAVTSKKGGEKARGLEYAAALSLSFRDINDAPQRTSQIVLEDEKMAPEVDDRSRNACIMPKPTFLGFTFAPAHTTRLRVSSPTTTSRAATRTKVHTLSRTSLQVEAGGGQEGQSTAPPEASGAKAEA